MGASLRLVALSESVRERIFTRAGAAVPLCRLSRSADPFEAAEAAGAVSAAKVVCPGPEEE